MNAPPVCQIDFLADLARGRVAYWFAAAEWLGGWSRTLEGLAHTNNWDLHRADFFSGLDELVPVAGQPRPGLQCLAEIWPGFRPTR